MEDIEQGTSKVSCSALIKARHKSAKGIAESLFVAESTVNSHLKGIYRKCDVHSRAELVTLVNRFKREQKWIRGGRGAPSPSFRQRSLGLFGALPCIID